MHYLRAKVVGALHLLEESGALLGFFAHEMRDAHGKFVGEFLSLALFGKKGFKCHPQVYETVFP